MFDHLWSDIKISSFQLPLSMTLGSHCGCIKGDNILLHSNKIMSEDSIVNQTHLVSIFWYGKMVYYPHDETSIFRTKGLQNVILYLGEDNEICYCSRPGIDYYAGSYTCNIIKYVNTKNWFQILIKLQYNIWDMLLKLCCKKERRSNE